MSLMACCCVIPMTPPPPAQHVPPSTVAELRAYIAMAGEGRSARGTLIPCKTFTLDCQLGGHPALNRHQDLLWVNMSTNDREKNPAGLVMNNSVFAYVDRNSSAGRDVI